MGATAQVATSISFAVYAPPITQGSMRTFHRFQPDGQCLVSLVSDNGPKLKEWRALVATQAKRAMRDLMPFEGPVKARLDFKFERPKSHKTLDRSIPWVAVRGRNDVDKLQRAIFDAMTLAAVYWDDAQVVDVHATKTYCDGLERPGVRVTVGALT